MIRFVNADRSGFGVSHYPGNVALLVYAGHDIAFSGLNLQRCASRSLAVANKSRGCGSSFAGRGIVKKFCESGY